jgi:D-arabinose 1-dehydrogenase-like Zn-dependent alcohol dehydrogenase
MFCISKEEFAKILKNIGAKWNHISIDTTLPNSVVFSGKGDTGRARVEVDKQMLMMHQVKTGSRATYSIEHLQKMMKAVRCSQVKIEYSDKMPLKMWMQIGARILSSPACY